MDKVKCVLNGKFSFKALSDRSVYKSKVICSYCQCELSYHCTTSSSKYHLLAKHTANANAAVSLTSNHPTCSKPGLIMCKRNPSSKLPTAIYEQVATVYIWTNIVEDEGLHHRTEDTYSNMYDDWRAKVIFFLTLPFHCFLLTLFIDCFILYFPVLIQLAEEDVFCDPLFFPCEVGHNYIMWLALAVKHPGNDL